MAQPSAPIDPKGAALLELELELLLELELDAALLELLDAVLELDEEVLLLELAEPPSLSSSPPQATKLTLRRLASSTEHTRCAIVFVSCDFSAMPDKYASQREVAENSLFVINAGSDATDNGNYGSASFGGTIRLGTIGSQDLADLARQLVPGPVRALHISRPI
jgi:hypothetical protein